MKKIIIIILVAAISLSTGGFIGYKTGISAEQKKIYDKGYDEGYDEGIKAQSEEKELNEDESPAALALSFVATSEAMISAVDDYLDSEIDAKEAAEKVEEYYHSIKDPDDGNDKVFSALETIHMRMLILKSEMFSISLGAEQKTDLTEDIESLLSYRNSLAELVGVKQR